MATIRDEEEQKGQGLNQALGQQPQAGQAQPQEQKPQVEGAGQAQIGASSAPKAPQVSMPKQQKAGTGTFANLKSYLQAAQGGGKVAQAATQRVQNVAGQAQKGIQQAQQTFGQKMKAGSGSLFQAGQNEEDAKRAAQEQTANILAAARGVTYQAPQPAQPTQQQTESKPAESQPTAPAQTQQYFTPEQQQRFAEIINAQYQGPESLQQAGLYEQAARKAQTAQQAVQQAQSVEGRAQLLRDIFSRNRDYSRGQSKLDALLLNTSQQGVEQLQQKAQQAGNIQQQLQQAQNLSANEAAQRAAAIEQVRSGARTAFTEARKAEEDAANERIKQIQDNWEKLPEYFKEALKSGKQLSQQEADLLGVTAGTGFYNLTPEQIVQTNKAEAAKLISKNELSRQLALQQLAASDVSKQLQKGLLYTDLEKAGTQTAADAINKQAIKDLLTAQEERFKETASTQDITGYGKKKHKTTGKKYYAEETANLKDVLERAGYDFNKQLGSTARGDVVTDVDPSTLENIWEQSLTPRFTPEASISPYTDDSTLAKKAGYAYADLSSMGITAGLRSLGLDVTGGLMNTADNLLGTSIFGGGGPSSKYAKNTAKRLAQEDLQRNVEKELQNAGFYNRALVGETEETKARQAALAAILANQEKYRG